MLSHLYIIIMAFTAHILRKEPIMNVQEMSQTRIRAWFATAIWTLAGVGFSLTFFSGGGVGEFDTDSTRHLACAAAIAFGFFGWWTVLWFTRRWGEGLVADERDLQVVAKAGQTTLIIVLVGIFSFTIGLWIAYEGVGVVPVGWMWFLAYGMVILVSITFAVTTLVLDGGTSGHG